MERISGGDSAGGSRALGELIDGHGSALAWDLHGQGIDLCDVLSERPQHSPRYILALAEWLPDDGAFAASLRGGAEHHGRGALWHLLADQWDIAVAAAMSGSKKKPPTYPRPGAKRQGGGIPMRSLMPKPQK